MSGAWVFCQLGAREHYVLPRAFHRQGRLRALVTEAWSPPGGLVSRLPGALARRFADRYASELAGAPVASFTAATIAFEIEQRLKRRAFAGWSAIMARNDWFERHVVAQAERGKLLAGRPIVFAYSYAALGILRAAKAAGCVTVLGQIDPAIAEEDVVADAVARHADLKPDWSRAPAAYWARWREECALADHIVVNSPWARDGLVAAGIDTAKLAVVPLAYEGAVAATAREVPARFDDARPLRVLFLGSLVVRKGAAELIEAVRLLAEEPVEFHLVGHESVALPADILANPRVIRHGAVARGGVAAHYAAADVFILPSLSDGFGLTQIEAQAHGLPVIASRACGDVVRDGVDGFLLDAVTGESIATAMRRYLAEPTLVARQGEAAADSLARFTPDAVAGLLDAVAA